MYRNLVCCLAFNFVAMSMLAVAETPLAERLSDATVFIQVEGASPDGTPKAWSGTGVIVSTDGYVVTNCHVAPGYDKTFRVVRVYIYPGTKREFDCTATVIANHPDRDIAILKCDVSDRQLTALPVAAFDDFPVTSRVLYAGYPAGRKLSADGQSVPSVSVSSTTVTALRLDETEHLYWLDVDKITVGGASGSPMVNEAGQIIAILARIPAAYFSRGVPAQCIQEMFGDALIDVQQSTPDDGKAIRLLIHPMRTGDRFVAGMVTTVSSGNSVKFKPIDDGLVATIQPADDFEDREVNLAAIDVVLDNGMSVRRIVSLGPNKYSKDQRLYALLDRAKVSFKKSFGVPYDNPLDAPDPFAIVSVNGKQSMITPATENSIHFAERAWAYCHAGDRIIFELYDKDVAKHDHIGSIEVTASAGLKQTRPSHEQIETCRLSVVALPHRLEPESRLRTEFYGKE